MQYRKGEGSSLYAKLKQRYGDMEKTRYTFKQSENETRNKDAMASDLIKLTCYDFKVTQPLETDTAQVDEENRPTQWWKALCLCSLLPEEDPGIEAWKHDTETLRTKHNRKNRTTPPRPIAEGIEDRLVPPPNIMVKPILDRISPPPLNSASNQRSSFRGER